MARWQRSMGRLLITKLRGKEKELALMLLEGGALEGVECCSRVDHMLQECVGILFWLPL